MLRYSLGALASSIFLHAAASSTSPAIPQHVNASSPSPTEPSKTEKACGVCRSPEMASQLSSLLTAKDGTYRLPAKRVLTSIKPYKNPKYMYTSAVVTPTGHHLGDFTDYRTFGAARRWAINEMLQQPTTLHIPYYKRFTQKELADIDEYYKNPEIDQVEVDYRIPSDPKQREEELGTDTENNVPVLLHTDGTLSALHCPPTYTELSRSTWTYLHTMAAYYPEEPSIEYQQKTKQFLSTFAELYPCTHCSDHMKDYIVENEIKAANNADLSVWMCDYHNAVNASLGKRIIRCSPDYLLHRYKTGYPAEAGITCNAEDTL